MQDPRMPFSEQVPNSKPEKTKRVSTKNATLSKKNDAKAVQDSLRPKSARKSSKPASRKMVSPVNHQPERSNSDSLPESSASGDEFLALRRKYLLLEEESFSLGSNLKEVEEEVKSLEDEKLGLLDKLVVLEGLIDPSEFQSL